jgi:hypothetical protein
LANVITTVEPAGAVRVFASNAIFCPVRVIETTDPAAVDAGVGVGDPVPPLPVHPAITAIATMMARRIAV